MESWKNYNLYLSINLSSKCDYYVITHKSAEIKPNYVSGFIQKSKTVIIISKKLLQFYRC